MGYMKFNKIKGHQRLSAPQKKAAGGKIKVTYLTEDGSTCEQLLNPDDKVMVVSELPKPPRPGMVLKKVTNVFRGETMEWLHILTSNGEEITCTREHPFSVKGKGWIAAGNLQSDDQFLTADGKECYVVRIWIEKLDKPETTYNFEVEGAHNYFVGNSEILVHNICVAEDGPYKAIVNTSNEHGHAHTHILKNGQRMAQVDKIGAVSKGVLDHGATKFVKNYWDDILKGINKYYPKK